MFHWPLLMLYLEGKFKLFSVRRVCCVPANTTWSLRNTSYIRVCNYLCCKKSWKSKYTRYLLELNLKVFIQGYVLNTASQECHRIIYSSKFGFIPIFPLFSIFQNWCNFCKSFQMLHWSWVIESTLCLQIQWDCSKWICEICIIFFQIDL